MTSTDRDNLIEALREIEDAIELAKRLPNDRLPRFLRSVATDLLDLAEEFDA